MDFGPGPQEGAPIERYVVLEYLSEGGMGAIYLGKKLGAGGFEKEVVLKQLLPEFTQQPEFIDLFLREARLSATLDHANIIHTIDLVTAGNEYFIVMEYLAGADLRTLAKRAKRRRKRFSAAAGIYIAREVLSALAYAHSKIGPDGRPLRLIHRDVSPSNLLVSRNGEVKLTDFGIAKAATHTSVFYKVKGKIGYMSPEQAKSEPMDHRSDLYSLAVCLYEIITGERLFVAAGLTTTPEQIYGQPIPLPSRKVPGLPAELDKVMLRALAIDPAARYQTAGELQEALLRCAHRNGLMMSAPELATHLRQVCGPPEEWRDVDDGVPGGGHTAALGGGGTEVYDLDSDDDDDHDDDEELDDDDLDDDLDDEPPRAGRGAVEPDEELDDLVGALAAQGRRDRAPPRDRASSLIDLNRLQNLELTSMIKLADVGGAGAKPIDDWGDLAGRLDETTPAPAPTAAMPPPTPTPTPPSAPPPRAPRPGPRGAATQSDVPTANVAPVLARPRWLWPAVVALALVIAAVVAAVVIGLSGPDVTPAAPGGTDDANAEGGAPGASSAGTGSGPSTGSDR
ncbi:MAG TPA: serine/threonine-protein kinase [Kofleriaceae bacterium]|jgi:serine/threonine protein kinase|nr:serine/threonine-protein kinase [Kofleriaceae bacterium]